MNNTKTLTMMNLNILIVDTPKLFPAEDPDGKRVNDNPPRSQYSNLFPTVAQMRAFERHLAQRVVKCG